MKAREAAAIAAGGALGALARVGLDQQFGVSPGDWPWVTFGVNIAGALILSLIASRLSGRRPPETYVGAFAGVGFCGALTTFSAFQLELLQMIDAGRVGLSALYAASSLAFGLSAMEIVKRGGIAASEEL